MNKITPQQKKTIRKVTEALKDSMISMTIDDLVNATGSSPTVIKNTLSKIEGVKQDENGYYLPKDDRELNAVAVNIQEAPVNMQDMELNTQAPHASYPDNDGATHINLVDNDTNADQSSNGQATVKQKRNKPFTPNPIMGYQVQKGKAKIFLDRRATSKTLTLSLADLKELVNAVEKSERVA